MGIPMLAVKRRPEALGSGFGLSPVRVASLSLGLMPIGVTQRGGGAEAHCLEQSESSMSRGRSSLVRVTISSSDAETSHEEGVKQLGIRVREQATHRFIRAITVVTDTNDITCAH
jgi:hypothetical protein